MSLRLRILANISGREVIADSNDSSIEVNSLLCPRSVLFAKKNYNIKIRFSRV